IEPCLFAGTFDPLTKGHERIVYEALKRYSKVYVAIGENKEKKPFFSLKERLDILNSAFNDERIIVDSYNGFTVDYMKGKDIKYYVRGIRNEKDYKYEKKSDAFNKTLYPELKTEFIYVYGEEINISSTLVRDKILKGEDVTKILSKNVYEKVKEILSKKDK
ncbi:MAG: pantetheine-phosphate adenylyltransferase, partial [Firmicutes bacterium]|nr:pantetheine-phosphate adenylyltransferase [Candidatus Caballimonas caccae]